MQLIFRTIFLIFSSFFLWIFENIFLNRSWLVNFLKYLKEFLRLLEFFFFKLLERVESDFFSKTVSIICFLFFCEFFENNFLRSIMARDFFIVFFSRFSEVRGFLIFFKDYFFNFILPFVEFVKIFFKDFPWLEIFFPNCFSKFSEACGFFFRGIIYFFKGLFFNFFSFLRIFSKYFFKYLPRLVIFFQDFLRLVDLKKIFFMELFMELLVNIFKDYFSFFSLSYHGFFNFFSRTIF